MQKEWNRTHLVELHELLTSVVLVLVQRGELDVLWGLGLVSGRKKRQSAVRFSSLARRVESIEAQEARTHRKGAVMVSRSCVPMATNFLFLQRLAWSLSWRSMKLLYAPSVRGSLSRRMAPAK